MSIWSIEAREQVSDGIVFFYVMKRNPGAKRGMWYLRDDAARKNVMIAYQIDAYQRDYGCDFRSARVPRTSRPPKCILTHQSSASSIPLPPPPPPNPRSVSIHHHHHHPQKAKTAKKRRTGNSDEKKPITQKKKKKQTPCLNGVSCKWFPRCRFMHTADNSPTAPVKKRTKSPPIKRRRTAPPKKEEVKEGHDSVLPKFTELAG